MRLEENLHRIVESEVLKVQQGNSPLSELITIKDCSFEIFDYSGIKKKDTYY